MLLVNLLQVLEPAELERLHQLPLKGKEALVMDYCLANRDKKVFSLPRAVKSLQISNTHLYKLNSVLFDKVLAHLFGSNPLQHLTEMATRLRLVPVVRHVMKITERNIRKSGSKQDLFDFYELCFRIEAGHFASDFDEKLLRYYEKECLKYYSGDKLKLQLGMDIMAQKGLINYHTALGSLGKKNIFKAHSDALIQITSRAAEKHYYESEFHALLVYSRLYFDTNRPGEVIPHLRKAEAIAGKHGKEIPSLLQMEMKLLFAKALYLTSQFEEAFNQYRALGIPKQPMDKAIIGSDVAKFMQLSLILGRYEEAKETSIYFQRFYTANNSAGLMARLHGIKYLVHTGRYHEAYMQLEDIAEMVKTMKIMQYMVEWRLLTALTQQLMGDTHAALLTIGRAIKFLYARNHPQLRDFIDGFQLLKFLCTYPNKQPDARLKAIDKLYHDSSYAQYGLLFDRIKR